MPLDFVKEMSVVGSGGPDRAWRMHCSACSATVLRCTRTSVYGLYPSEPQQPQHFANSEHPNQDKGRGEPRLPSFKFGSVMKRGGVRHRAGERLFSCANQEPQKDGPKSIICARSNVSGRQAAGPAQLPHVH
jgi:hypothetical protein